MIDFPGGVRYNGGTPVNLMDKESNMEVKLGEHLRSLRRRDGRTQEDLAVALDVTPQAVSRWENGSCYPDMALIPAMANYFGVTIDELFGYRNDRDKKVDAIIQKVESFHIKGRSDDAWAFGRCLDGRRVFFCFLAGFTRIFMFLCGNQLIFSIPVRFSPKTSSL